MCAATYKCIQSVRVGTRICMRKRWYTHAEPVIHTYSPTGWEPCRRGCEAAIAAPARMLLLFAKRCIILSAMSGISKRNTSGFAIVLRICSPIQFPPALRARSRHTFLYPTISFPLSPTSLDYALPLVPLLQELHRNWPALHVTGMHDSQITRKPGRRRRHPEVSLSQQDRISKIEPHPLKYIFFYNKLYH